MVALFLAWLALLHLLLLSVPPSLAQSFAPITVTSSPLLPSLSIASAPSPTLSLSRANWLGSFLPFTSQCTPSPTCCCSSGRPLVVTADASSALAVDLAGSSDGGAGCFYQANLGGVLTLTSTLSALASFPALSLNVTAALSPDLQTLSIATTRTTCAVEFQRSSATPAPSADPPAGDSSGGAWSPPGFAYATTAVSDPASPSTSSLSYQTLVVPMAGSSAGAHSYAMAFAVPESTPISSVFLHYATTSAPSTVSAAMDAQSASPLSFPDESTPLLVYEYAPLVLSDSDVLTYAFSYLYAGRTQFTPFTTFTFNSSAPVTSAAAAPSAAASSLLIGQYLTSTLCVPSSTCCCGEGLISVQQAPSSSPSSLLVTGALDGGAGCHGQTELSGGFVQGSDPLSVSGNFSAQGLSVGFDLALSGLAGSSPPSAFSSMSPSQEREYYSLLTLTDSLQSCPTTAIRVLSSSASAAVASPLQLPFVGTFDFIPELCTASSTCCCAVGNLTVAPSSANASSLVLAGTLDAGAACLGQSSISESFLVTSPTSASFSLAPITITVSMTHEARGIVGVDGNNALTFNNNLNPSCVSYAYRTSLQPSPPSPSSSASTLPSPTAVQGLLGSYTSDGSCVPSPQCCCTDGQTTVTAGRPGSVVVATTLDGVLLSCFNQVSTPHPHTTPRLR